MNGERDCDDECIFSMPVVSLQSNGNASFWNKSIIFHTVPLLDIDFIAEAGRQPCGKNSLPELEINKEEQ